MDIFIHHSCTHAFNLPAKIRALGNHKVFVPYSATKADYAIIHFSRARDLSLAAIVSAA